VQAEWFEQVLGNPGARVAEPGQQLPVGVMDLRVLLKALPVVCRHPAPQSTIGYPKDEPGSGAAFLQASTNSTLAAQG
jgi:hypothetical protein